TDNSAAISAYADGTWGTSDHPSRLDFEVTPDGSTTRGTVMTIKNNGNIGIGTTGPTNKLQIGAQIGAVSGYVFSVSGTDGTIFLQGTSATAYSGANIYDNSGVLSASFQYGNPSATVFTDQFIIASRKATTPVIFYQGGSTSPYERLRLDTSGNIIISGNVGIGTSILSAVDGSGGSVAPILFVNGSGHVRVDVGGSSGAWIDFRNSSNAVVGEIGVDADNLYINRRDSKNIVLANIGGNVGIGTTSPATKLEISGSGQQVEPRITSTHASGYPSLNFYRNTTTQLARMQAGVDDTFSTNGDGLFIANLVNDGKIHFRTQTGGTPGNRLTILGNGNVGIGTTSPSYRLDVAGIVNAYQVKVNGTTVGSGNVSGSGTVNTMAIWTSSSTTGDSSTTETSTMIKINLG
ncbi:MAG: hypothetical protein KKC96_01065, partial [Nanoarchaeota archaeon]|nr:hypothetical protein [Nanoarchaeota archaeon]